MSKNAHIRSVLDRLCLRDSVTLKTACDAADVSYSTLKGQLYHDRPIPFETLDQLTKVFDCPIMIFSARRQEIDLTSDRHAIASKKAEMAYRQAIYEAQRIAMGDGYGLDTDDILDWLRRNNNRLENFDRIRENVELFRPIDPSNPRLELVHNGANSLSTRYFRAENTEHFSKIIHGFGPELVQAVIESHMRASKELYTVNDRDIDQVINGIRIRDSYRRILAPVMDDLGNRYTLVFSRLLR